IFQYYSVFRSFSNTSSTTRILTLSLHDALPICVMPCWTRLPITINTTRSNELSSPSVDRPEARTMVHNSKNMMAARRIISMSGRSEEHTSELQSRFDLVCRLLLEKKINY